MSLVGLARPIPWPPLSPDFTPLNFFFWGFIKDRLFVLPLTDGLLELRNRIYAAVAEVTPNVLARVGIEIDFRWDTVVCRIKNGAHIEQI